MKFQDRLQKTLNNSKLTEDDYQIIHTYFDKLSEEGRGMGLELGEKAPDFRLPGASGRTIRLYDFLGTGPIVLSFYRGDWCPFCNIEIEGQEEIIEHIRSAGATLFAIGPQSREHAEKLIHKFDLSFELLLDEKQEVISTYKLDFPLSEELDAIEKKIGIDLSEQNADGTFRLPVPATFVLDSGGIVRARFASFEWWRRMDPLDIYEIVHSLSYFESLFRNAPVGMAIIDTERNVLGYNRTMETQFPRFEDLLLKKKIAEKMEQILQREELSAEFRWEPLPAPNSNDISIVNVNLSPFKLGQEISGVICTLTDVTDQARRYAELENAHLDLKNINNQLNRLLSIIGHDLKNPIGGVRQLSRLLRTEYTKMNIEELGSYLKEIDESTDKSLQLLEDLLQWARNRGEEIEIQEESFSLNTLIEEVVDLLSSSAEEKAIQLETDTAEERHVRADRRMIAVVLRNLVSNAIKFTHRGGRIRIGSEKPEEEMEGRFEDSIRIYVEDTGVGMSPEEKQKIFQIDKRYTTSGTEQEEGTGLGVVLCSDILDKHGRNLEIDSTPEKGSRFSFTLPTAQN